MIKINAKGLAKFITSGPSGQRKTIQDFKYPAEDEPFAMRVYYKDAKDCIKSFHRHQHSAEWLRQASSNLLEYSRQHALHNAKPTALRLEKNARALQFYCSQFTSLNFAVLPDLRFRFEFSGVSVSVAPDLHFDEGGQTRMVKVNFGGREPALQTVNVITQCLLHAATAAGHDVSRRSVMYVDLPRGKVHYAPRTGTTTMREIRAACETISALWDSIPPPSRKSKRRVAA